MKRNRKTSTRNRLELETLGPSPVMLKFSPNTGSSDQFILIMQASSLEYYYYYYYYYYYHHTRRACFEFVDLNNSVLQILWEVREERKQQLWELGAIQGYSRRAAVYKAHMLLNLFDQEHEECGIVDMSPKWWLIFVLCLEFI